MRTYYERAGGGIGDRRGNATRFRAGGGQRSTERNRAIPLWLVCATLAVLSALAASGCTPTASECRTDGDCRESQRCLAAGGLFVQGGRCISPDGWSSPRDVDTGDTRGRDSSPTDSALEELDTDVSDSNELGDTRENCDAGQEVCNGLDDDCDGDVDEARPCPKTEGVCAGTAARCTDAGRESCSAIYPSTYEEEETRLDGLDNDCDGTTDELFTRVDIYSDRVVCAVLTDGSIYCWVDESGYTFETDFPVDGSYVEPAAGNNHACARTSQNDIDCWGGNKNNDFGIADPPKGTFRTLDAGLFKTCAVTADANREVECWGTTQASRADEAFKELAVARGVCGIDVSGSIDCWGIDSGPPDGPIPSTNPVADLDISDAHGCLVGPNRRVECWGDQPAPVPSGTFRAVSVTSPYEQGTTNRRLYACGIEAPSGGIRCWGYDNNISGRPPSTGSHSDIAVGRDGGCAVRTDGALVCWGDVGRPDFSDGAN